MKYGSILEVSASGASEYINQAQIDSSAMEKYKNIIGKVGRAYGVDPALIAGIISRESSAGVTLVNGWGDGGKAWGLMQVDVTPNGGNHHASGGWDSEEHLRQGTGILVDFIEAIKRKFPTWSKRQQLKGGIAAYNAGDGRVTSINVDLNTFKGNYADDVVTRAHYYKNNHGY